MPHVHQQQIIRKTGGRECGWVGMCSSRRVHSSTPAPGSRQATARELNATHHGMPEGLADRVVPPRLGSRHHVALRLYGPRPQQNFPVVLWERTCELAQSALVYITAT